MELSQTELAILETEVGAALERRDTDGLTVLGYGEVSIALGYPAEQPRLVCKRLPPMTTTQLGQYRGLLDRYLEGLGENGIAVAPTRLMPVEQGDQRVGYLVQPLFPSESLGHRVLGKAPPTPTIPSWSLWPTSRRR